MIFISVLEGKTDKFNCLFVISQSTTIKELLSSDLSVRMRITSEEKAEFATCMMEILGSNMAGYRRKAYLPFLRACK
jgi:hypothetical protein